MGPREKILPGKMHIQIQLKFHNKKLFIIGISAKNVTYIFCTLCTTKKKEETTSSHAYI